MKDELTDALVKDFPLTFARDENGHEPWSMFGFEVNDGWEPSIRKTAKKLELLIRAAKLKDPKKYEDGYYRTAQIKEKYGFGRWYLTGGTDEMFALTDAWEDETTSICETCGKPGKLRGSGWYYTACFEHTKLEDKDNLEILENASEEKENVKNKIK